MYKKLSEQGLKGEALEQAIYEKHGWEGVEEARMIAEYESGNPKHSLKEQTQLVESLEEDLDNYKKIVKNFEEQGETGLDYEHYKKMVERQEGALEQAKSQLEWIKRHTKESSEKLKYLEDRYMEVQKQIDEFKKKPRTEENLSERYMAAKELQMLQKAIENEKSKITNDSAEQEKVGVVMKEFKEGTLKSGSGEKVTNPKQAIAIALSEAKKAKDEDIPDEQDKPETAGEEKAEKEDNKMEDKKKESLAEDKCAKDEKVDKRKLIDEIGGILKGKVDEELWKTIIGKAEKIAYNESEAGSADDEDKIESKKDFAEGVVYGEKKEKEEPKKLDSEHESEGMKKFEEKKEAEDKCGKMAKDEMTFDIDTIKAQVRQEVIADFKAREEARKAVKSTVGDVNVMAFDSCEDIYKFACEKAGMNLNEIASYKDAFKGFSAGKALKGGLALDATPKSSGNVEECLKDIRS